jgi:hypothetical protein
MKTIFTPKEIHKFFGILDKLNRACSDYYPNKNCQRSVFVRRVFKHFHPFWMLEIQEPTGWFVSTGNGFDAEEAKLPIIQYIVIGNISYRLGYGQEIDMIYAMAGTNKMQGMKVNYNIALGLKGRKISKERYNKVASLFIMKEKTEA